MAIRTVPKAINPTLETELGTELNEHELAVLSQLSTLVELPAGKPIAIEGTTGREAVVLVQGEASIVRNGETIATATQGAFLGEMSLLDGAPRNASVVADTPVVIAVLSVREFHTLLSLCPRLERLIKTEAGRRSAA